jgi:hypothetical protein
MHPAKKPTLVVGGGGGGRRGGGRAGAPRPELALRGEHLLHLAELRRQHLEQARLAQQGVHAELLHDAGGEQRELQTRRVDEHVEEHPPHELVLERLRRLVEPGARLLDQLVVDDPARARRLAAAAVEAEVQVLADGRRRLDLAVGQTEHELDAAARGVALVARLRVRRARRQAQAAVNARQAALVGARVELQRGVMGGGRRDR